MSSGFNSDVNVGADVCHVQTEDHGQPECLIETLVYHRGRIFHRRTSNYSRLVVAPGISEEALRERVEAQHRAVMDAVRDGAIAIPPAVEGGARAPSDGIQVRLRNASSWVAAGHATLDVQVVRRGGGEAVANANVEASFTGLKGDAHFSATTGEDGVAELRFAMPPLGANGAELVIRAKAESGSDEVRDEVRYALRSKSRPAPPETKS
ncbi:MAG TPA: hypothetical protein VGU63_12645, partial [Candidatus Acidoferrales bacterium]|nr:hypothetical protein [Candidatus Acidoferrales bacterium]